MFKNFNNVKKIFILKKNFFKTHWLKLWLQTFFNKWDIVIDLRGSVISYLIFNNQKYILTDTIFVSGNVGLAIKAIDKY